MWGYARYWRAETHEPFHQPLPFNRAISRFTILFASLSKSIFTVPDRADPARPRRRERLDARIPSVVAL